MPSSPVAPHRLISEYDTQMTVWEYEYATFSHYAMYPRDVLCCFTWIIRLFFVSSWKLLSLEELNCLKYQSQSSPRHIWALNCTERKPKCVCSVLVCFLIQCVMCSVAALLTVSHSNSNKSSIPFLITLLFTFMRIRIH